MIGNNIYFAKTKDCAVIPSKREEDAGYDIYPCFDEEHLFIAPHETVMIPTGIASAFSSDYAAVLQERGSTGTKGIGQRAGVIDSGYRGEWMVPITNHNKREMVISKAPGKLPGLLTYPYEKAIAQCIIVEVPKLNVCEMAYEELVQIKSERGTGRIGSSGK